MHKLEIYQSLWAMEQRQADLPEPSADDNFARIADAGYHGVCLDPDISEIDDCLALAPLFERYDLGCMINAFPSTADELQPLLDMARELNACQVNVIGGVMPLHADDAAVVLRRWQREGERSGIPLLFETHRDSTLNDLYYTLQLLDLMPDLRLCADLSHFVVDREFRTPLSDRDRAYIERILEHSDSFQGRVANREQVQVQIGFAQHQEWVEIFKAWWREGMVRWRQRQSAPATLRFLCELGPPSYAMTDANGRELSDRWEEALTIRSWVETIWQALESDSQADRPHGR
jgi:sugar phosphate isomerase/epimerase